jgi:hypothetical protein
MTAEKILRLATCEGVMTCSSQVDPAAVGARLRGRDHRVAQIMAPR